MKSYRIYKTKTGYTLVAVSDGKLLSQDYPTYPTMMIEVLKNIGWREQA